MKLGAQLYSVRDFIKTPEDTKETFRKIKKMGYDVVQWSGGGPIDPHVLAEISREFELPIVCTHISFDRLVNETDAVIEEHKLFGCKHIGLGAMPKPYRNGEKDPKLFFEDVKEAVDKIHAAGLTFAFHNHNFDFDNTMQDGEPVLDYMIRTCTDWQFILDTYWIQYVNRDVCEYIAKIGKGRLINVHFKDMADDAERSICACGDGIMDFASIYRKLQELGCVENILVEQDNAVKKDDPFGEMQKSYNTVRAIMQ